MFNKNAINLPSWSKTRKEHKRAAQTGGSDHTERAVRDDLLGGRWDRAVYGQVLEGESGHRGRDALHIAPANRAHAEHRGAMAAARNARDTAHYNQGGRRPERPSSSNSAASSNRAKEPASTAARRADCYSRETSYDDYCWAKVCLCSECR